MTTFAHVRAVAKLPLSFDGNPILYATSLASLMCIACLGLAVTGWMTRDTWRDRFMVHPKSLLFTFRTMMAVIGLTAFVRCLPEVLYLQAYGEHDLRPGTIEMILTAKRVADTFALPMVAFWMLIFVAIYPPVSIALKSGSARMVIVDRAATWPRLVRPFCLACVIVAISVLTAYSKVYGG